MATTTHDVSYVFIELGLVIVGLAVLARLASRWGFSAIPLYLLAGLAFGNGGLAPLRLSENFVRTGAEIGVLLLLFMLGLEYTGDELRKSLRLGVTAGVIDFALNFTPGLVAGFLVRWRPLAAVLLGGVTYISSSGVIAKVLAELRRMEKPETPLVLSVLVQEDLAMAVYLPLVAVLLSGGGAAKIVLSVFVAIAVVSLVALGGRAIWTSAKPACRSRIRRNHSADDPSVPCCWWLVWHSDSKFPQQLEHFWSALRCLVPLPSSHIVWSVRCETCSPQYSFSFLG